MTLLNVARGDSSKPSLPLLLSTYKGDNPKVYLIITCRSTTGESLTNNPWVHRVTVFVTLQRSPDKQCPNIVTNLTYTPEIYITDRYQKRPHLYKEFHLFSKASCWSSRSSRSSRSSFGECTVVSNPSRSPLRSKLEEPPALWGQKSARNHHPGMFVWKNLKNKLKYVPYQLVENIWTINSRFSATCASKILVSNSE